MHTYKAAIVDKIDNGPGSWNSIKVGVFRVEGEKEEQVGEYIRNYSTLFRTFFHFRVNKKDYALYSPDYTGTRIMELPSCKDIGGEEPSGNGFCPVDFYVPCYIELEWVKGSSIGDKFVANEPGAEDLIASEYSKPVSPVLYYPFGFVAGCVWGDDSSWKIQYLDLSEVEKGIIKRDDRFGYIEMPYGLTLKQCVDLVDYNYDPEEDYSYSVLLAVKKRFDLRTGKVMD